MARWRPSFYRDRAMDDSEIKETVDSKAMTYLKIPSTFQYESKEAKFLIAYHELWHLQGMKVRMQIGVVSQCQ